jgi:hypothetical protein
VVFLNLIIADLLMWDFTIFQKGVDGCGQFQKAQVRQKFMIRFYQRVLKSQKQTFLDQVGVRCEYHETHFHLRDGGTVGTESFVDVDIIISDLEFIGSALII